MSGHLGLLVVGLILGMADDDSVLGGYSSQNINISSHWTCLRALLKSWIEKICPIRCKVNSIFWDSLQEIDISKTRILWILQKRVAGVDVALFFWNIVQSIDFGVKIQ